MSNTKDYLDYLNNEVGIAPAASQEELDLAQALADEYAKHGLDPEVQEFPAASMSSMTYGIVMVCVFIGMILVGIGTVALTAVGLLLVAAGIVLLALTYTGRDVLAKVGPRAHSQNVVAVHRAEGEGNDRNRPVVVLAHYDTPRVDVLASSQLAIAKKYLAIIVPNVLCAVAVCAFIQLLVFLPEAARRTFWIIGIIAALPVLFWGGCLIARRFSPYADGAVGNKSSVAALLTVMDRVCSGDKPHERKPASEPEEVAEVKNSQVRPATRMVTHTEVEEVVGKRHGEAVLRELGILPEDCEITYIAPEVHTYEVEEPIEYDDEPLAPTSNPAAQDELVEVAEQEADNEPSKEAEDAQATIEMAVAGADNSEDALEEIDPDVTRPMAPVREERLDVADQVDLSQLENGEATDEGPLSETDHSGLNTMADEDAQEAASTPRQVRENPAVIDDPEWGKSTYTPSRTNNVARRASLFDLPNVGADSNDGLSSEPQAKANQEAAAAEVASPAASYGMPASNSAELNPGTTSPMAQRLAEASARVAAAPAPIRLDEPSEASQFVPLNHGGASQDSIEVLSAPVDLSDKTVKPKQRGLKGIFGGGSNRSRWKGGAARSINLRGLIDNLPKIGGSEPEAAENENVSVPETPKMLENAADPEATKVMTSDEIAKALQEGNQAQLVSESEEGLFTEVLPENSDYEPILETSNAGFDADTEGGPAEAADDLFSNGEAPAADEQGAPVEPEFVEQPIDRELRDAILAMDNDELKAHDVWFVATGASELGHAGVAEFVAEHRKDLRGAFIINLESVGAGELTVLTNEGFGRTRRADRRLVKLINSIASDMHMSLAQLKRTWADTEATPCMRRSLRAVTLMGMGDNELPAYASTPDDAPEVVDEEKVVDAVAIINEVIKRS